MNKTSTIAWILFAICLVDIALQYSSGGLMQGHLLNSDTLFLPSLLTDVFSNGGSLSDWSLPPAPYFFPDLTVFSLLHAVGVKPYYEILVFALCQTGLLLLAVWLVGKSFRHPKPWLGASFVIAVLTYFAVSSNPQFDFVSGGPFVLMLSSVFHFGVFLTSIVFVAVWLGYNRLTGDTHRFRHAMLLSAIAFLSSMSDSFFIVQTIVPIACVAVMQTWIQKARIRDSLVMLLGPVLGAAGGYFAYSYWMQNTTRPSPRLGFAHAWQHLDSIIAIFRSVIETYPVFLVFLALYVVIVFRSIYAILKQTSRTQTLAWISVFSAISIAGCVASVSLLTNIPTIGARYLIPAFFWPVIISGLFATGYLGRGFSYLTPAIAATFVGLLTWNSLHLYQSNQSHDQSYPSEIACIDQTLETSGVTNGVAQYWDARYLQSLSRLKLNIAQHSDRLDQMFFVTSKRSFKDTYDFAIASANVNQRWQIPLARLAEINGTPSVIKQCGSRTVYVYGKDKLRTSANTSR